jgi:transcriptional regulator with XRE-family HTH domain
VPARYGDQVTSEAEIKEFLTTRRSRLTPERAGLPMYGRQRRVAGLRREEVALLAGISVEYYTRLERGNARGVSEGVLDAICGALQLDEAERDHLRDLVRDADAERPQRRTGTPHSVRPSVQRIVDALTSIPAFVRNGRLDILYANPLGEALYSGHFSDPVRPPNSARFAFLDPRARSFYVDWDTTVHDMAAALRGEVGRHPYDRSLSDLIGLLSTRSEAFRVEWARHDVRFHRTGTKRVRHPLVGELTLDYEVLQLSADPGLELVTYSAAPGSVSEAALGELFRWAVTREKFAPTSTASRSRQNVG